MAIKHSKVSAIADGTDTSLVRPSDWNDAHVIEDNSIGNAALTDVNGDVGTFTNATVTVNSKGRITAATSGTALSATSVGGIITGAAAKFTPVDADSLGLSDSAASGVLKKFTWANLKAALGSIFAALAGATFTGAVVVPDDPYSTSGWSASTEVPTKKAVRDKIEAIIAGTGTGDMLKSTYDANNDGIVDVAATVSDGGITTIKIAANAVTEAKQGLSDVTTNDVSTTKHGYAPKAPGDATKFLNGNGGWTVPESSLAQNAPSVTTGSLANLAEATGVVALGKVAILLSIVTDRAARVRLYRTAAYRAADSARPIGTDPTGEHGLLFEGVTSSGNLTLDLAPSALLANGDTTPASDIYYAIQNRSGATSTVLVTFQKLTLEA